MKISHPQGGKAELGLQTSSGFRKNSRTQNTAKPHRVSVQLPRAAASKCESCLLGSPVAEAGCGALSVRGGTWPHCGAHGSGYQRLGPWSYLNGTVEWSASHKQLTLEPRCVSGSGLVPSRVPMEVGSHGLFVSNTTPFPVLCPVALPRQPGNLHKHLPRLHAAPAGKPHQGAAVGGEVHSPLHRWPTEAQWREKAWQNSV